MDERTNDRTTDEGALDPDERFGQGTDASHPESATGQPIEQVDEATAADRPEVGPDDSRDA